MRLTDRAQGLKPDFQVDQAGQRMDFEVRLSTTYLTEIVGPREFYSANNVGMSRFYAAIASYPTLPTSTNVLVKTKLPSASRHCSG